MSGTSPRRSKKTRQQLIAEQHAKVLRANGLYSGSKKPDTPGKQKYLARKFKQVARLLDPKQTHKIKAPPEAVKQAKKAGFRVGNGVIFSQKYGEDSAKVETIGRGKNKRYVVVKRRGDKEGETRVPLGAENHPDRILDRLEAEAKRLKKTFKSKNDRLAFRIKDANGNIGRNTFSTVEQLRKAINSYSQRAPDLWRGFLNSIEIVKTTPAQHAKMRAALRAAKKRHRDARERKTGK